MAIEVTLGPQGTINDVANLAESFVRNDANRTVSATFATLKRTLPCSCGSWLNLGLRADEHRELAPCLQYRGVKAVFSLDGV